MKATYELIRLENGWRVQGTYSMRTLVFATIQEAVAFILDMEEVS